MFTVYCHTNRLTDKKYVGQTCMGTPVYGSPQHAVMYVTVEYLDGRKSPQFKRWRGRSGKAIMAAARAKYKGIAKVSFGRVMYSHGHGDRQTTRATTREGYRVGPSGKTPLKRNVYRGKTHIGTVMQGGRDHWHWWLRRAGGGKKFHPHGEVMTLEQGVRAVIEAAQGAMVKRSRA